MPHNEKPHHASTWQGSKSQTLGQGLRGNASSVGAAVLDPVRELILPKLEGVRQAGASWTARCPAHPDRTASLSLAAGSEGQALIHCFAGCAATDVLAAIGLELHDLYPQRLPDLSPMARADRRKAWQYASTLAAAQTLAAEGFVIEIAARQIEAGEPMNCEDCDRIRQARETCHGAVLALEAVR